MRNWITPALVTPNIINKVHPITYMEGIPSGIKISNRIGLIVYTVPVLQEWIIQKTTTMKTNLKINKEMKKMMMQNHQTT